MTGAALALQSCTGIMSGLYDEPSGEPVKTSAGQLYIDASDWGKWHYIDLSEILSASNSEEDFNPSDAWKTFDIPMEEVQEATGCGIHTYWYDVFGVGISNNEPRNHYHTALQPEPERWTFAVHRNNARTNGCAVAETKFSSFDEIPTDKSFLSALNFACDTWNEKDVWCIQDQMLLGLIGNQRIKINETLSSWLSIDIPPIPPAFTHNNNVFIMRLPDGSHAALQLENYQSVTGTKCCLTINYRYPL